MSIRAKFVALLAVFVTCGIGVTGAVLIVRNARHERDLVTQKQLLLVEHGAFAMREGLSITSRELMRLARLLQADHSDGESGPERELLRGAHTSSIFFQRIRVVDEAGRLTQVAPEESEPLGRDLSRRHWFAEAREAKGPFFEMVRRQDVFPDGIGVVVPLRHGGRFRGALQGMINLDEEQVLTPELRHTAGERGEFVLAHADRRVFHSRRDRPFVEDEWRAALGELHQQRAGWQLLRQAEGEYLYAYAPIGLGQWGLAMRWQWRDVSQDTRAQIATTIAFVLAGMLGAALLGVLAAAYLTRPLRELNLSLEERVRARTKDLEEAQSRLLEAERFAAMGRTSAAIAHELKNALNGLGMCVDLVLQDAASGTSRVRLQIRRELARLRDITESLLTFARTPRLERAPVDLHALVESALDLLADPIGENGITIERAFAAGGAPLEIVCDGHKIEGVLINLIKNAVEAMAAPPLDLNGEIPSAGAVSLRRLGIATARQGEFVEVAISDSGPGLAPQARPRLFEPFFTTKVTGTGLGLATARRVAEAHGGTLSAEDALGGGARFVLRLPVNHLRSA